MNTGTTQEAPSVLTEIKALAVPDMSVMNRGAESALRMAQSFVITTQDDYQLAGEELQSIKGRINVLEGKRTGITGPMNKALTAINDLFRGPMATLKAAENAVKSSMLSYSDAEERKAAEERRIAEAAAAAERARIAEAARQIERAASEARQRMAEEAAAVAAAAKVEQERLAAVAAEAAAAGNKAAQEEANRAADASRQAALLESQQAKERDIEAQTRSAEAAASLVIETAVISAAVTNINSAKAAGTSIKVVVDYEVTSLISLVRHIALNPALINLVMEDSVKLRAYVRGLGLNTELPGVRVFQKRSMAARAA